MTKNINLRNAARAYQVEHPGTTFPDAKRAVELLWASKRPESRVFNAIASKLPSLFGRKLSIDPDQEYPGGWSLVLDRDLEGPSQILDIEAVPGTLEFQVHEELDDGAKLGEARVKVTLTYDAFIYKSDYYAASDDVDWWAYDTEWNDDYVLVNGEIKVELIANVIMNSPDEIEIEFMGVESTN